MRRVIPLIAFLILTGCTLNTNRETPEETPRIVTATLGFSVEQIATPAAVTPIPQIVVLPSATLSETQTPALEPTISLTETATPEPSVTPYIEATVDAIVQGTLDALATAATVPPTQTPTETPAPTILPTTTAIPSDTPTATITIPPTVTLPPTAIPPTRTRPGPPTVLPLDDGSGNVIPGTGSETLGSAPVPGVTELPETLYYLSGDGGVQQIWRLRIGFTFPDQITFSPNGVTAFDVASNGALAYITPDGQMIIDGIPFLPPPGPDGVFPQVTALAWSPAGDWLVYTLQTPGAADTASGEHAVDGLWMRSQSTTVPLEMNTYGARIYSGPLDWRPDGSEVLVKTTLESGTAYSRVNITNGAVSPLWDASTLLPGSYADAVWNVNGNAIIASGAGAVLHIEPDTLAVQTLLGVEAGLNPSGAVQFANGTLTFVSGTDGQLYTVAPGQSTPTPVTRPLTTSGARIDFLWDNFGQQTILTVYEQPGSGTAYLRDAANTLYDLTALTGPVGSPLWGPVFRSGDMARVHTTEGDTLNVRNTPGGGILIELVNGSRVTITGGPSWYDGLLWWRLQTPDGVSGWAVESVTDDQGQRLRTLLPALN